LDLAGAGAQDTRSRHRLASRAMSSPMLLAVPNVSEGRSGSAVEAIAQAFAPSLSPPETVAEHPRLLDVHSDADHHRSVFTLAGRQGALADALLAGARVAGEGIGGMNRSQSGRELAQHPHVGALDIVPIVYLDPGARGAACAEALVVADRLAEELGLPVFLYGELTAGERDPARSRAQLRRGGGVAPVPGGRARAGGEGGGAPRVPPPVCGPPLIPPGGGGALGAARPP